MPTNLNTDTSIVDYLKSTNQDSSYASRAKLAADSGVANYTGTPEQNTQLLTALKSKTPTTTPPATTPPSSDNSGYVIPTGTTLAPGAMVNNNPMTSSELDRATTMPDPVGLAATVNSNIPSLSDRVSSVAKTVFTGNKLALDNLRAQQEADIKARQDAEQAKVNDVTDRLNSITTSTQLQDKLDEINRQFDIPNKINMLTDISNRIVQAQDALNVGLAYEQDRPARLQVISGRMNTLKTQGLATIGALQGAASVIQGNINLARSYASQTLDAIKDDNARSINALKTLLDLHNNNLMKLNEQEKATVDERIKALKDQVDQLDKDRNDIQDFMTQYPSAFLKGGVTLTDTKDEALKKMLPYLAKTEELKLAKSLATKASGGSGSSAAKQAEEKSLLLQAKNNGMKYSEAILAFADTLPVSYIDSIYPEEAKVAKTIPDSGQKRTEDAIYNNLYGQYFDEAGNIKAGYEVSTDPKTGKPTIQKTQEKKVGFFASLFGGGGNKGDTQSSTPK